MILVDTNVISDVLTPSSEWLAWSIDQLNRHRDDTLVANDIVFTELSARLRTEADVHRVLSDLLITLEHVPTAGLFAAGQAFRKYRAAGGSKTNVLPDFFIGAHAQAKQMRVLTRDPRPYRAYFPRVDLIAPD
jgi:predicted nucleic acid-binding protein